MTFSPARAFTFGRNWRRFLRSYTPQRQAIAKDALLAFLQLPDLRDKTFLDIGSGSGIHSAAAFLSGAKRIHSFDYDPDSVEATRALHKHFGSPAHWTIEHGSVLDADFTKKLGTFDIVYSWGVLHHTGDQWLGLTNARGCLSETGRLYIALYAKEVYHDWPRWLEIKHAYNEAGWLKKRLIEIDYIRDTYLHGTWKNIRLLPGIVYNYRHSRGMEFMTDARDWLGGWPTEFSSVPEVRDFAAKKLGLTLVNLRTGEGNSEFLFATVTQAEKEGLAPINILEHIAGLPVLSDPRALPKEPVWIFGSAQGGELMHAFLKKNGVELAGFVDIGPQKTELFGLPVLPFETFVTKAPTSVPIVLANRYVKENRNRLYEAGYTVIFDGHPQVIELFYGRSLAQPTLRAT